jgi:transposase InsO family protein
MSELCEECEVSRKTGYKWIKRYSERGLDGLLDKSRAPLAPSRKYPKEQIDIVLELKQKRPSYGPKKICAILNKRYPEESWPGPTRLYEILKEHHLVCSRKLRRRVPRTQPLGEVNASNDVWCADFKGWFLTKDKSKVEPFTVTDGFSRFIIRCDHFERKRFEDVWKSLSSAFHEYGLPQRIRTDNGPPFATTGVGRLSQLSVHLIKAGVTPEWINPGHPEENGRHERFHKSLKYAVANPPAETFGEQLSRIKVFIEEYNFERPHESLGLEVPGSYYSPSPRIWDGRLRSPEYDTSEIMVRKVGQNGCINVNRNENYIGSVISGEYVGLKKIDEDCYRIFYGPVLLGTLLNKNDFRRPELPPWKQR